MRTLAINKVNNTAPSGVGPARPGKKSYANATKVSKKPLFTLMAKVAEPGSSVSVKQIHSLLDFEKDGPPVQDLRVANDKIYIKFRSQEELNTAKSRLEKNVETKSLMGNIHAPQFAFPVLVKVSDVDLGSYPFPNSTDTSEVRKKKVDSVKENLGIENPFLAGHIKTFRVLNTRVTGSDTTHLVHLGLASRQVWVKLLKEGKIVMKNIRHVVSEVDPNKEVMQCKNCHLHGHSARFCPTPDTAKCPKCGGDHRLSECVSTAAPCCLNCKGTHMASSFNCPSHIRLVKSFLSKLSKPI